MDKQLTIIELTPCNVRLLTGYNWGNKLEVMQSLEGDLLPLNSNGLLNKSDLKESITTLLSKAKSQLSMDTGPIVILYPPIGFVTKQVSENSATGNDANILHQSDYASCNIKTLKSVSQLGKKPIYLAPYNFKTDSSTRLDHFPINCTTRSFEVDGDVHLMDWEAHSYYRDVIDSLGLKPYLEMISSYASSQLIYKRTNETKYLLLDLEHDYTILTYVKENRLVNSFLLKNNFSTILKAYCDVLKIDSARGEEFIHIFGFLGNLGFEYFTDEGYSFDQLSNALRLAFEPMLKEIHDVMLSYGLTSDIKILVQGAEKEIFGLDTCLSSALQVTTDVFRSHVLGASLGIFDSCLGAIFVSTEDYQQSAETYRRSQYDTQLKSTMFDR